MPGNDVSIKVEGLSAFRAELKKIDAELAKGMGKRNQEIGNLVVSAAQAAAGGQGGIAAKSAGGITAAAKAAAVYVKLDGNRYPAILGAEFGGGAHGPGHPTARGGHTNQFKPWKGNGGGAGYFLYPTIHAKTDEILEKYGELVSEVTRAAFDR